PPRARGRGRPPLLRPLTPPHRRRRSARAERRGDRGSRRRAPDVRRADGSRGGAHRPQRGIPPMTAAIRIQNLTKTYRTGFWGRKVRVLHGVDLVVERGAILGLLGPNGAGKSTTLKCVLRLVFPTEGEIEIFGVSNRSPEALERVGYMPEHPALYPKLLPLEILDFAGRLAGLPKDVREARAQALVREVGLGHALDRPVGKYSKGMKQRIGLAQALMSDPDLLILDEPF